MTVSRPTPLASWNSGTTRLRGKHSTLRIHSWLPHGALNGSNGWTHNLAAREFANDTAICGLQHNCREQRLTPEAPLQDLESNGIGQLLSTTSQDSEEVWEFPL